MKTSNFLEVIERLPPGPLRSTTGNQLTGKVPIISQSESGFVGFHDGVPGVEASIDHPVVTFANHTCAVRWHETAFSSIQNVFPLRGKQGVLDTGYLYWFLKQAISSSFYGGHWPALAEKDISYPEIKEQRCISARLKTQLAEVATARQAVQLQLRDAALLRQRLLRETFDALDDIPHKVLSEWATTTSGSTPSRGDKRYWSPAEIPWVKTGEVAFAPITHTEESISKQALVECSLTLLAPQTVLIAMYGQGKTRGQSAILEIEATTNQACFAILPNDTWDADFLHHWLMASYQDLRSLSDGRGGNQANLNGGLLNALQIPAPGIDDQRHIVAHLKKQLIEVDALRTALEEQQRDLENLPQRILAQTFEN